VVTKIVVDTSLLVNHLRKTTEDFNRLTELDDEGRARVLIPYEVVTEMLAGESAAKKPERRAIENIIDRAVLVGLTRNSAIHAGELIRKYPQIPGLVDLIVAAVAIEQKAMVATHNPKHFRLIKGLKIWKA
jgi:predicted nucleic acid-binding protein